MLNEQNHINKVNKNIILIIDAASERLRVVAADGCGVVLAQRETAGRMEHSASLMPAIDAVLAECQAAVSDAAAICVCVGPGSFTGIRVGIACAAALAFSSGAKLIQVNNLEVLAYNKFRAEADAKVGGGKVSKHSAAVIDAGKELFYFAEYAQGGQEIVSPKLISAAEAAVVISDGAQTAESCGGLAQTLAELCAEKFRRGEFCQNLQPLYLRKPQAQEELERKKAAAEAENSPK